jgi:hypothetical protein
LWSNVKIIDSNLIPLSVFGSAGVYFAIVKILIRQIRHPYIWNVRQIRCCVRHFQCTIVRARRELQPLPCIFRVGWASAALPNFSDPPQAGRMIGAVT